jgi:hypothetical protein
VQGLVFDIHREWRGASARDTGATNKTWREVVAAVGFLVTFNLLSILSTLLNPFVLVSWFINSATYCLSRWA